MKLHHKPDRVRRPQMGIRRMLAVLAAVAAAAIGIGFSVSGSARGDPYKSTGISVSPASPAPGGAVEITARGYLPGSTAIFLISTSPSAQSQLILLGRSTVDANGVVTDDTTIPGAFQPHSRHAIQVMGVDRNLRALTETTKVRIAGKEHHRGRTAA